MTSGLFISFEGGEGAGKSTQIKRLAAYFKAQGRGVVLTREPGGTPGAEAIRALLVTGSANRWDAMTETLLNTAARRDHVEKVIRPALQAGKVVLSDRFAHSTLAYQAGRDGVSEDFIRKLHREAIGDVWPDITFIFEIDPKYGLARAGVRDGAEAGRYEKMDLRFHQALRERFVAMAENDARCHLIDASADIDTVHAAILGILQ